MLMPDRAEGRSYPALCHQRIEKLQQVVAFVKCREVGGVDFLAQMVIFVAAADVMREGVFQGGKRTIVHEGCAMVEVAEGGRFEAAHVCIFFGLGETDFRLLEGTPIEQALGSVAEAIDRAGPNREEIRDVLASGANVGGIRFETSGTLR